MPEHWVLVDRTVTVGTTLARRADGVELVIDGKTEGGVYKAHAFVFGVPFELRCDETFGCMMRRINDFYPFQSPSADAWA